MPSSEDKINSFITAREGEIEGLENFSSHLSARSEDFQSNVVRMQTSAAAVLPVLERLHTVLDTQLLRVNASNSETLTQQLLNILVEIRASLRSEEQSIIKEFGFVYGSTNTANETIKTLNEKIESAKASVSNQKELLERAATGDPSNRDIGERPISMKDQRKFDEIVNNDE